MVQRLIVPVDGSHDSWRALDVAVPLALRCDASIDVCEVVLSPQDQAAAERRVSAALADRAVDGVEMTPHVELARDTVPATLAAVVERHPEAIVVMASHGRGRSAAVLGSVTGELLEREFGPVLVVGPHVESFAVDGPIIATVDGSDLSEQALPLAAAWAIELGVSPWIVEVNDPGQISDEHLIEASYPARLARHLTSLSKHTTEFEVLHDAHPHEAVAEFAERLGASMIVATTHGFAGLRRLRVGSTAAAFVRHARCPVMLLRPPAVHGEKGHSGRTEASV